MKKLLSLALVAVMVLSSIVNCFAVSADAVPTRTNPGVEDYDNNPEDYAVDFWLSEATIGAGETTATITANVKNNMGIWASRFYIIYPGCLTVSKATPNYNKNDPYDPNYVIYTNNDIGITPNKIEATKNLKDAANGKTFNGKTVEELITSGYKYSIVLLEVEQLFLTQEDEDNVENKRLFCNTKAVDGALCSLEFTYDEAANTEKATNLPLYMISSSYDAIFCYGEEGYEIGEFTPVDYNGSITVPKPVSTEPTITVSDAEITVGDATADFTVTVENNPGLYGLYGFVAYQAPMALTAVTCGKVFDGLYMGGPLAVGNEALLNKTVEFFKNNSNNSKNAFEAAGTPDDYIATRICADEGYNIKVNNTANGTLITFSLDTSKLTPGTYDISFVIDPYNTINIDAEEVSFNTVKGTLTVSGCAHDWLLVSTDPADCTNDTVEHYECSKCGATDTKTVADSALGHDHQVTNVEPAACTTPEITTYICSRCGDTYTAETAVALGHAYNDVVTAPTCTENGYTTHTCARCGDSYTDTEVSALGHAYNDVVTAPTCTEKGYTTHTCARCGDSYTDTEVDALGHNMHIINDISASCTETGRIDYKCSRCDAADFEVLEALGHAYNDVVTAPTCTEKGFTTHTCARCGDSYTDTEVDALGHAYNDVVTAPTCTEKGYTTHTCSRCGDSYTDTEVDALGHDMREVNRIPATCTKTGRVDYKCSRCDAKDSEVLEALGHDYKDVVTTPTCTEKGFTTHTCTRCGDSYTDTEIDALGHNWADWTVVTYPTISAPGLEKRVCSRCGEEETRDIEQLTQTTLTASNETTTPGGTATVTFTLTGNPGIWGQFFVIYFPKALTVESVTACTDVYSDYDMGETSTGIDPSTNARILEYFNAAGITDSSKYKAIAYYTDNGYEDSYADGLIVSVTFRVPEAGKCNKHYDVNLFGVFADDGGDAVNWNGDSIDPAIVYENGGIDIPDGIDVCDTHQYGEWTVTVEPTCSTTGMKKRECEVCGYIDKEQIEMLAHTYGLEVVPPTFFEQGYTLYTCSVCGDTYRDAYVDPLERIDLSNATLKLEYDSVYYEGIALTPDVTLTYEGETYDSSKELKITYTNNNQVGTATVTIEGINRFKGTVELQFEISYEVIPEQIVNVIAIGEIGKVSLSWGESSEVNTDSYNIYRKADGETEYQMIKTVSGRNVLSYEDKNVEKKKTYSYYVTGVGLYGAESEPSLIVTSTVLVDEVAPTILKVSPAAASVITGKTTLSSTVTDNVGVTRVAYFYSLDNGENWAAIGETTNKAFSIIFDTTDFGCESVKVKAVAYDAEGNESEPITVVYSLDNVGPEKVTGLSAVTLSSKITLSWNDVTANDAAYFILQTKTNEEWRTVATKITTLGYTITGLQPNTDYIYRVACVDTHGNIGEYSDEFTARTAIDETAPVITSQSPNSARYNSTINFSATAKDDCDVETIEIQVSTDLSSWTTINTKTYTARTYKQTYTYTIDLGEYAEGSIFVRAIATDFSGNISDTSESAPYTEYIVDKTAPEAPTGVSANGNDGYITVSWSMGSESDLGKYFVYKSTSLDGNYQLVASNLSSLNYHDRAVQSGREFYYKVKVSDTCGNMSEYSNAASATMSPDTQKPEITSISSTYQQKISSNTHTINVAATDNNKLSYIVVEYCTSINPKYAQLVIEENIDNYYKSISVTLPIDSLTDGDVVYLRAYAVDMAGLKSEYATAKYTLDTTPPMVEDYSALLDVSTVYLDWKDNGESDLSGFKVYRSADGEAFTLLGSRGVSSTGTYSFVDTITGKESNTYIYKLESIDRLGNTASWLQSVDYTYVYVNQIPIARMSIPDFMTAGVEEIFDASGSTDDIVIMSYLWDFGDGTTSTEIKPVKSYDTVGTYTVKLSVTDNEGITSTITKDIEVKERDLLGILNVKVVDDNGKALPYVPVYFDLGSDNQKIIYTNASGVATIQMLSGTHIIGMYASGYLPVKKDVVVLANATRTVTLTTVEEDIVTGNFEITRMTFDEIVAAGIDVYDPANQNVYSATVRVTYGSTSPLTINYVRNDDKIISYTVKDSNGTPVTHYTNSNGENRKITGITYIPSSQGGSDVVAIMDIPAEASYLKEFFDVRLHIVNNASSEFTLKMNEVVLNVPEGMTLMTSVSGDYSSSNTVKIDAIKGQETVTLAWVLRGDKAGEYDLSADFTGTLAEFNELVTARFETEEPIKVYGLEGVKFRILTADEIHNDTLYFNIELENERDIDIYMPSVGLTDKIANVTESVLNDNTEGEFFAEAYILNTYIQTENGQKQYLPITYDANGRATTAVETIAPGQKIVYEYVAYNAINYDGVAYFKDAAITEFEGVIDNIETGSFHKELYSFTDYSAKLDAILSASNVDVGAAFDYIKTDDNYYYWAEAVDKENGALAALYTVCDVLLNADLTHFTNEDKKELIRTTLLSILSQSSVVEQADDLVMAKYNQAVLDMIDIVKTGTIEKYTSDELSAADIASAFEKITKNSKSLAITYRTKGSEAFKNELTNMVAKNAMGLIIDASVMVEFGDEAEIFSKSFGAAKKTITALLNAAEESDREAYYYSVLKLQCNAEISNHILDSIIAATQNNYEYSDMINDIAVDLKTQLNSNMEKYYKDINYAVNLVEEAGMAVAKVAISAVMKKMIGSTPLAIVSAGFNILDAVFGFDDYYKQQDFMCIYNALTISFVDSFSDSVKMRNTDDDFYSMLLLRAVCELRLSGEKQYKSFIQDYINGVYGKPLSEKQVIEKINGIFGTGYTTTDEWWDNVQYNIVHSRDILFNVEGISELDTPRAPVVTLDYDKLQTVQSFTSEYEYCFADGVWKDCVNEPITFKVGVTPSVLRVRKAASDTNFAGEISTVKIFARKDLSKLIAAKFDGVNYLLDNLSAKYNYQVIFTNDLEATVDWSAAQTIAGSDSTVKISGVGEYSHIIIRSCQNADLYETTSNPLSLTVSKKKPLNLVIDGNGTVTQTSDSGCYFNGEAIDLIVTANTGCSFIGWYIDDVCVSTDEHYIVEMADELEIVAQFTGVKINNISIEELPTKLNYYEGESLDLNGIKVLVTYSDDTTAYAEQFAAHLSSNAVGKSTVVITYGGYSTSYDVTISHNDSAWITTVNATMFNEGLKVKRCTVCHNVVATEVLPMLVDESGIVVDTDENLIYNIPEYLFASNAIITHYGDLGCRVKILDSASKTSTHIMTGGYIMYAGTKYSSIIFGDTNGDGEIDIFDILGMLDHVNGDTELEGVYKKAGLIVNEEEIDIFDTLAVLDHVNGDASINP